MTLHTEPHLEAATTAVGNLLAWEGVGFIQDKPALLWVHRPQQHPSSWAGTQHTELSLLLQGHPGDLHTNNTWGLFSLLSDKLRTVWLFQLTYLSLINYQIKSVVDHDDLIIGVASIESVCMDRPDKRALCGCLQSFQFEPELGPLSDWCPRSLPPHCTDHLQPQQHTYDLHSASVHWGTVILKKHAHTLRNSLRTQTESVPAMRAGCWGWQHRAVTAVWTSMTILACLGLRSRRSRFHVQT